MTQKKMMQEILKASDYKFEKIAKNYLDSISQKTNKNFITDKMPFNFKVIGIIKRCFPDAKIIHCYRNKNDNLISIYKTMFRLSYDVFFFVPFCAVFIANH